MKHVTTAKKDIRETVKVQSRNEKFVEKASTELWQEIPTVDNPYIAERALCHGYDMTELLQGSRSTEVLYLLFKGELPDKAAADLLDKLMIMLCNPGPRHNATRAAMHAGVGKTEVVHILPIALTVMGGAHLGGTEVQNSMRFLKQATPQNPQQLAEKIAASLTEPAEGDTRAAPGFGTLYGGIDALTQAYATRLTGNHTGKTLHWAQTFAQTLNSYGHGWLMPGLAASIFLDLGFDNRAGATLYQLFSAPGLLAHGLEMSAKPVTAMPFIAQENYHIEP